MTRPRRNTILCRRLASQASATAAAKRQGMNINADQDSSEEAVSDDDVHFLGDVSADLELPAATIDTIMSWKEGAGSSMRVVYTGDSRTTLWRRETKKQKLKESVKDVPKITTFFATVQHKKDIVRNQNHESAPSRAVEMLNAEISITPNAIVQKRDRSTKWDFIRKIAVRHYLKSLDNRDQKISSSEKIAAMLFPDRNIVHSGRLIRFWAQYFVNYGELPVQKQGKFVKKQSLIHDEDVQRIIRDFIRSESQVSLVGSKLSQWVAENLHVKLGLENSVLISQRTAQRWLKVLGLRFGKFVKGLYNDGHERADVVQYRNAFLDRMLSYEKRMIRYVGDFMETAISPDPANADRALILITHDESCFGSNDGRNYCWLDDDHRQIRPKGNGRSVMVSAFLCECHGILRLDEDQQRQYPDIPADSTVFLKPGANSEGYWKNCDLVLQIKEKALPIFKLLHPNCDGLFMFDNSQNHHAKPPDALSVSNMNLRDGGANQRLMRCGWFLDQQGNRVEQKMVLDDGATSKGVMRVLKERNLWDPALNLKQAKLLLSAQPDFKNQLEWLEEVVTEGGCSIDFYPKYHCEFNFIEMFWGAAKAWSRANCSFNFNEHVEMVPKALESVSITKIRKFARKSYRYMDAYRIKNSEGNSLTCKQIEYAVKKYRGHRKIPLRILEIDN
jgi:hypothetical protein